MSPRFCSAGPTRFSCLRWGLGGVALPRVGCMYVVAGAESVRLAQVNCAAQKLSQDKGMTRRTCDARISLQSHAHAHLSPPWINRAVVSWERARARAPPEAHGPTASRCSLGSCVDRGFLGFGFPERASRVSSRAHASLTYSRLRGQLTPSLGSIRRVRCHWCGIPGTGQR